MGRWRRGQRGRNRRGGCDGQGSLSKLDLESIRSYLNEYRLRAEEASGCENDRPSAAAPPECGPDKEPETFVPRATGGDGASPGTEANINAKADADVDLYVTPSSSALIIAGHAFAPFDRETISRPYLDLPATLTSKHRHFVHEVCVDVGLYHASAGSGDDRRLVVSVREDGLGHVRGLDRPAAMPVHRCPPWFYQNHGRGDGKGADADADADVDASASRDAHVAEVTRRGRAAIEALIDQPGRCLRSAPLDVFDLEALIGADLSSDAVPPADDVSSWRLVDSPEALAGCVAELRSAGVTELGFDMEMVSKSKFDTCTCLIQLHGGGIDYIVDPLAPGVWASIPGLLGPIFADPTIVKIGHSVGGMDCPSLHRDFGIFLVNCFDTYEAARTLRLKEKGLAGLCRYYKLGGAINGEYDALKVEYQASDWARRPLTDGMIQYGRYDARFLVKLRSLLIRDLVRLEPFDQNGAQAIEEGRLIREALSATLRSTEAGESAQADTSDEFAPEEEDELKLSFQDAEDEIPQPNPSRKRTVVTAKDLRMHLSLMRVICLSQEACLHLWKDQREKLFRNDSFLSNRRRAASGEVQWGDQDTALYEALSVWREGVARREGNSPAAICSLNFLVAVAMKRPVCIRGLRRIEYLLPAVLESNDGEHAEEMLSLVRSWGAVVVEDSSRAICSTPMEGAELANGEGTRDVQERGSDETGADDEEKRENGEDQSSYQLITVFVFAVSCLGLAALIVTKRSVRRT